MKIATWNVNSLRVRLPHLLEWLAVSAPDIVALQEIKLTADQCPEAAISAAGYQVIVSGQKTYNGVALLSRNGAGRDIVTDLPGLGDPQRRVLAASYRIDGRPLRVLNLYVPNGQEVGSDKYAYKLDWLDRLADWLEAELTDHPDLLVLGDFNIAPEPADVYDPAAWKGKVLCSEPERAAFRRLLELGLVDTFRRFEQPAQSYSWWDYRMNAFRRNIGLRIDHILASPALAARCTAAAVEREPRGWERPSDHAPVVAEFTAALPQRV